MDSWYLVDDSSGTPSTTGPFTLEQLREKAVDGSFRPGSLVAAVGSSEWVAAATDPRLASLFGPESWSAPPRTPPVAAVATTPSEYSFATAFELGWNSFTRRWSSWLLLALALLGMGLVALAPQQVLTMVGQAMVVRGSRDAGLPLFFGGMCLGFVLQILVGLPLFAGATYAGARVHRGEGRLGDIFEGFRNYGTAIGSGVMLMLIYAGCGVVAFIPFVVLMALSALGGASPSSTGLLLFIGAALTAVLGIGLMALIVMRFFFAPVIAIDPAFGRPGAVEAFRISWRQTGSRGWSMLLLLFAAGLLAALTILLFCVGYLLVGIPLLLAIVSAMYHLIYRPEDAVSAGTP